MSDADAGEVTDLHVIAAPEQATVKAAKVEAAAPNWREMIGRLAQSEDGDVAYIIACVLNTQIDAMQLFENRTRFLQDDVQNAFRAARWLIPAPRGR